MDLESGKIIEPVKTESNTEKEDKTITASSSGGSGKPSPTTKKRGRPRLTDEELLAREIKKIQKMMEEGKSIEIPSGKLLDIDKPKTKRGRPKLSELYTDPRELKEHIEKAKAKQRESKRIYSAERRRRQRELFAKAAIMMGVNCEQDK